MDKYDVIANCIGIYNPKMRSIFKVMMMELESKERVRLRDFAYQHHFNFSSVLRLVRELDSVGLLYVMEDVRKSGRGRKPLLVLLNRKEFARFLRECASVLESYASELEREVVEYEHDKVHA